MTRDALGAFPLGLVSLLCPRGRAAQRPGLVHPQHFGQPPPSGDALAAAGFLGPPPLGRSGLPALTEEIILAFVDIHRWWTGSWPRRTSGPVLASPVPGETWARISTALILGQRGLPGGCSLAQFLAARRGVRNTRGLPPLTEEQIVAWARAHYARHGVWPTQRGGPVEGAPGEVWANLHNKLRLGGRGLPGGTTLPQLLARHGRGNGAPPGRR